jgi:hypothetical protein
MALSYVAQPKIHSTTKKKKKKPKDLGITLSRL